MRCAVMKAMVKPGLALIVLFWVFGPAHALAASVTGWDMEAFEPELQNQPSMQRGFRLYVNYCLGCHSLQFQRYERTADDLGIPHDIALESLIFTNQKVGDLMTTAMDLEGAKKWFGAPPPDLTMITRVRDPEWLYNYLKTFYVDETRPFGVNNRVFPNVGMPHVLADLQGLQVEACDDATECSELFLVEGSGSLSETEYDQAVRDITNFLHYVGDPSRVERYRLGIYVLLFLVILGVFTYLLNREIWKDVH